MVHCYTWFTLLVAVTHASALDWDDLRCTFSALDVFRIDSFFQLPRTYPAAKAKGWQQPTDKQEEKHIRVLCEKNDGRICLLYDDQGYVAGYQIAIPVVVDSLRMPGIDFERMGFEKMTLFGKSHYTFRAYFVPQGVIESGGRIWDGRTGTSLWIPIKGRLTEIPKKESVLPQYLPEFKVQNCYEKMGRHYFYNISRSLTPEYFYPIFILYSKEGDLQGFGLNAFGSEAVTEPFIEYIPFLKKRNWFENVPSSKIRNVAPDTPQWILDYKDKYGGYSHHVYFIHKPWQIEC